MSSDYRVPEAKCEASRHEIHHYTQDEPDAHELPAYKLPPKDFAGDKYYYGLRIVTGSARGAGGVGCKSVYAQLIGSRAQSGKVNLTSLKSTLEGSFTRKKYDDLVIESHCDLGDIQVVVVGISHEIGLDPSWFVDFIIVHNFQSKATEEFPCYNWLGDEDYVSCTAHTTTVKDVASNPVLMEQRREQLKQRCELYQWKLYPDKQLPSYIDSTVRHLPPDEQFDLVKNLDFTGDALKAGAVLGLNILEPCRIFHEFEEWAKQLGQPQVPVYEASRWETDVEFGRQMLNGVNPVVIEKCTHLPPNFPVTNEMVKGFLNRGLPLEGEMEAGHVYICNLKIMDNLTCRKDYYCCAPICLLYVNGSGQLVPIAIQLNQKPGDDNPIFLPSDHLMDWLLAKIYYQSAHGQFHEISTHYLSCHAAMEAYAMATMRNLPDPHPINKLLRPHFRYTMAINARARETLINTGGIIDQAFAIGGEGKEELFRRGFEAYSVYWTNIKRSVKERGVDNPDQLPGYYYRDDGMKLWRAIETCAAGIINLFYQSDDDVKGDGELQNWATAIHDIAFPAFKTAPAGHGFPDKIKTRDELAELCTMIMFTGSAQHASINFGQYDFYAFIPNAPFGMRRPPPTKKGTTDLQILLDSLPDKKTTMLSIGVVYLLSQYSENEIFVGTYPYERFTEESANKIMKQLQETLEEITADIVKRNKPLDVPYTFLLPGKVPNSITI